MAKATFSMVNEGITAMPFIVGRVMLPVLILAISNLIVSLALFVVCVNTCVDEVPANFKAPCICAIALLANNAAKISV